MSKKKKNQTRFAAGPVCRGAAVPDQAVIDGAAAREEPWLWGVAVAGVPGRDGQREVREAVPHRRGPALGTNTRTGAKTEAVDIYSINTVWFNTAVFYFCGVSDLCSEA